MECPYLEAGGKYRVCSAAASLMVPGIEETEAYCMNEEHYLCPSLLGHVLRGGCTSGSGKKVAMPQAGVFSR